MDTLRGNPPDVPFRAAGVGHGMTFKCAACLRPSQILGRRLRRVHGVRQWVCGGCAKDPK